MAQFNEQFGGYKILQDPKALHLAFDQARSGEPGVNDVPMDPNNPPGTSLLSSHVHSFNEQHNEPASASSKKKIYPKRSTYVVPAQAKKNNLLETAARIKKTGGYGFQDVDK
jgi:hypothetical protein